MPMYVGRRNRLGTILAKAVQLHIHASRRRSLHVYTHMSAQTFADMPSQMCIPPSTRVDSPMPTYTSTNKKNKTIRENVQAAVVVLRLPTITIYGM